ncbi:diacylglycerol kinase [Mycoplasmoides fastidiosum]|uniref:Diacylglycerol kinase n=1 Tax=Mycoplasmoides fastidiosum TaxID=92758 RepID=A0ABU0LZP1_9BACT|nr:diacylglycerol kinase [Mycoplasmoides fastidiosum]MDQ0514176.1 diacylglycerol kinase [Mycoplasmoides fastidiosum]UUD37411.1 diacylglycerol kinase [Mycoplasmoides fastidiosum]
MNKFNKIKNQSFRSYYIRAVNAFKGLYTVLKEENSFVVIFIIIFISYITAGILHTKMTALEWIVVVITGTLILVVEVINTAIENIVDLINFRYGINAKKIKNIASAASLLMILGAIIVYLILFISKVVQ